MIVPKNTPMRRYNILHLNSSRCSRNDISPITGESSLSIKLFSVVTFKYYFLKSAYNGKPEQSAFTSGFN